MCVNPGRQPRTLRIISGAEFVLKLDFVKEYEVVYGGGTFKSLPRLRRKGTLAGIRNVIDLGAQGIPWITTNSITRSSC